MSPTLRSNTTSPGRTGVKTTPTKSPRKVPHCSKCQRPRAGHPRQGCPYTESPRSGIQPTLDITQSMDSLVISPTKTKPHERQRRQPAHEMTLASLSTESSEILNRLLQPEIHWPFREGRIMPGTLITPRPSFLTEIPEVERVQSDIHGRSDSKASVMVPPPPQMGAGPLPSTAFLDGLAEVSWGPPAAVYSIHAYDLHRMAEAARNLGFYTGSREEGLLILGRDVRAVEDLLAKLSRETPKQSSIRAVAGGAVAGAVATFTGLALA
ncbi:hypothetical protein BGW80DRAFT_1283608 [Lactifluus volemus]|nr:hypothetical protein BGW80DRAFT_1283608 [Lactifluus volemus]